ncbi:unnamed protein product [Dracunculus medinensis]|uniref:Chitin-binding type-2 domain-containing protein n=1 Tax=Dracunculus medinensis TaxID=318479 RepID=A0A0N4UC86_DRAME|nr:unnamed protein product [Dracunculus medinensis]
MCMTIERFRAGEASNQFFECSPFNEDEIRAYGVNGNNVGIWNLRTCPDDEDFDETQQRCVERRTYRRQQANCILNPTSIGCRPNCQGKTIAFSNQNPIQGDLCNWRMANLQADPFSEASFLQCVPQSQNEPCGRWTQMACAPGTTFALPNQICISLTINQGDAIGCPPQSNPVCACAQQQPGVNRCPGQSRCMENFGICCQQQLGNTMPMPNFGPPVVVLNQELGEFHNNSVNGIFASFAKFLEG